MTKSIHWFRKGLRLHDNPAFLAAYEGASDVWPVFVLDPWFVSNARVGINRWSFLLQTLEDLDRNLRKFKSRLFVVKGNPVEVFPTLFKDWGINRLTFEIDTEPYSVTRDAEVEKIAASHGVEVIKRVSHTLYDVHK